MDVRSRAGQGLASAVTAALALAVLGAAPAGASAARSATSDSSTTMQALAFYNWHLAPSLAALRTEVNTRWPNRDRSSDGAVGDARHQASRNSHNPARLPGGPAVGTQGSVHALDITARGIDVNLLLNAVVGDPRIWYVIHNGQIWSRTTNWAARAYRGDPHTTHIHINLREDSHAAAVAAERDTSRWLSSSGSRGASVTSARSSTAGTAPMLSASGTRALQRALIAKGFAIPSGPTGWYGPETTKAVAAFQRAQGWRGSAADGIAGALTLRRLGISAVTTTPAVRALSAPTKASGSGATGTTSKAPTGLGAYKPGTASREVYFLQQALIERGYAIPAGATGYFGAKTVEAVRAFQRAQGWPAQQCDGIPGAKTLALLGLS